MATPHHLPKKRGALKSTKISFSKAPQFFAVSHSGDSTGDIEG